MSNRMSRSAVWAAALAAGVWATVAMPLGASAFCALSTPTGELAAVPADGAIGVPTDADLWVLAGSATTVVLTVEGGVSAQEQAAVGTWRRYRLAGVAPGDTVTWSAALSGAESDQTYGPYTFQVGADAAGAPEKPVLDHVEARHDATPTTQCDQLLNQQECFDTGQSLLVRVHVAEQPAAALYRFCVENTATSSPCGLTYVMPATCTPAMLLSDNAGAAPYCYRVAALNAAGVASEELVVCPAADTEADGGGEPAAGVSGGCAASPDAPGGMGGLVALGLLVLATRRRAERPSV